MGSCSRRPASNVSAGSATHPNCSTSGAGPPHPRRALSHSRSGPTPRRQLAERIGVVDHAPTHLAATAERGVLARLEAGCSAPIAAHATVVDGVITLTAAVFAPDGQSELTIVETGAADSDPLELADRVAAALLERGAATLAPLGSAR